MEKECIKTLRALATRGSGKMTNNTAKASKPGKRVPPTKETMPLARKRAKESTAGLMAQPTKETGSITK